MRVARARVVFIFYFLFPFYLGSIPPPIPDSRDSSSLVQKDPMKKGG